MGEADLRTVAEAIASGIKARPIPESLGFIVRASHRGRRWARGWTIGHSYFRVL